MSESSVPEEFVKVIRDFVGDLKVTFPEYITFIDKWWKDREHFNYIDEEEERNTKSGDPPSKRTDEAHKHDRRKNEIRMSWTQ